MKSFFHDNKDKTIKYLLKTFAGLNYQDCEDIFQESSLVLLQKHRNGELSNLKSSLCTFFVSICRNKSLEFYRKNQKNFDLVDDFCNGSFDMEKVDFVLALDDNQELENQKSEAVRKIVQNLPDPCDKVLWGYFRDNFSVKTLAAMYDKTEINIRVTKLRCCEKFKNRFQEEFNKILNN
ncbi:MAG: sigma-70 family RNA polymerase sigma factor [Bacteroidales bacterium]|nr:sigma-70 family RNA polymerase sigma factor [Bacteroidales bacterium]